LTFTHFLFLNELQRATAVIAGVSGVDLHTAPVEVELPALFPDE